MVLHCRAPSTFALALLKELVGTRLRNGPLLPAVDHHFLCQIRVVQVAIVDILLFQQTSVFFFRLVSHRFLFVPCLVQVGLILI